MPSYMTSDLIKKVRLRKKWQQDRVLQSAFHADTTLSRIENRRQKPTADTLHSLLDGLQMPMEPFFYPYLEGQTTEVFILRDQLLDCLDNAVDLVSRNRAESLLHKMENLDGFKTGINRQFILSCRARLYEIMEADPSFIMTLIREGICLTYPEFDEDYFLGSMLIFEEIELLHTRSLVYGRIGDLHKAVKLLDGIQEGLTSLPEDDHEKEKKLAKILLTLSRFLIHTSAYDKALDVCDMGCGVSLKRNKGKYIPDFLYNKAICLYHLGRTDECPALLRQAFFGYKLLRKDTQAWQLWKDAAEKYNIIIKTYGIEKIFQSNSRPNTPVAYGDTAVCKDIGDLIGTLRVEAGMSLKTLSRGICSVSNLHKIENGGIQAQVYYLEALMQRLGRDINLYTNTFLSAQEFEEKQIRDEITNRLVLGEYEEASELLAQLETSKTYQNGVNLQFINNAKASIILSREGNCFNYLKMLNEGLRITLPDFDERKIDQYRLTFYETTLINKLAGYYAGTGELARGVKMYERLRDSMNHSYVDETEKIRTYAMVLYNYSKYLGIMERYKEALEMVEEGEMLEVKHGRLNLLPSFAVNKACDLLELGKKEESIPYFALAYYGSILLGKTTNQNATAKYVQERLSITFD